MISLVFSLKKRPAESAPTLYMQTAQTTGGRNTFEGLTPGQAYNVEANAVGSAGTSDWSDVDSLMVIQR
jgi:hypothetical protein